MNVWICIKEDCEGMINCMNECLNEYMIVCMNYWNE